jgi:DNA-binding MarR family transcriptional regulator
MNQKSTIQKIVVLQQQFEQIMIQYRFQNWMDMELTAAQFKCLFYIVHKPDTTSKKLSGVLGVTPADVTGVIDRLILQGFVQRQENPEDRRFFFLHATEKGKEIIEKLSLNAVEHFTRMLDGLSEEELDHVYLALSAITQNFSCRKSAFQKLTNSQCCRGTDKLFEKDKDT